MDGNGSIQQILIPANKVGLVIGKKGETIKQLQVWDLTAFTVKASMYLASFSTLLLAKTAPELPLHLYICLCVWPNVLHLSDQQQLPGRFRNEMYEFMVSGVKHHFCLFLVLSDEPVQERTGVQMIMIQDDPLPTGADKPLRITGDPQKVQVSSGKAQSVPPSGFCTLAASLSFVWVKLKWGFPCVFHSKPVN